MWETTVKKLFTMFMNKKSLFLSFRFLGVKRWKSLFWSKRWVRPTLRKWRWSSRTWRPLCPRWCWRLLLCREENAYIGEINPCLRLCGHQPCLLGDGCCWLLLWVRLPYLGLRWSMSPCQVEQLEWPQQSIFRFWQNMNHWQWVEFKYAPSRAEQRALIVDFQGSGRGGRWSNHWGASWLPSKVNIIEKMTIDQRN